MSWDEWYGAMDGRPVLWIKHLFCGRGRHIDLHKMVAVDDPDCFHTHPAYAIRIILWGGYVEEWEGGRCKAWRPGMIGLVTPTCSHRIAELRNGVVSYSLWVRFRKQAPILLRGSGWQKQDQTHRAPQTIIE
jgi:hypothetical protein